MKLIIFISFLFSCIIIVHTFPQVLRSGVQPNTPENLLKLKNLKKGELAWIYSGQYQGDILLTPQQVQSINSRNGITSLNNRWPKTVPYVLAADYTWEERNYIRFALDQLEILSCLKFVERTTEVDYVNITSEGGGCFAYVGRIGGGQQMNIAHGYDGQVGTGCMVTSTIQHEMLHALGFQHMQCSHDRDDFVEIIWDNIQPVTGYNFEKFNDTTHFGVPYDYNSAMHYPGNAFAIDYSKPTIVTKDPAFQDKIGQDVGLSRRDVERLNRMYECPL